jgi:hypothetical protein
MMNRLVAAPHSNVQEQRIPFRHFLMAPVLNARVSTDLLDQLDGLTWRRNRGSLFCFDVPDPSSDYLAFHDSVILHINVEIIVHAISTIYNFRHIQLFTIDPHKYDRGTGIGIHTDRGVAEFRFVLNLNRNWELSQGGIWILSSAPDLSKQTRYIAPIHNTGFGFRPGVNTFHALSERVVGTSYALVFRFLSNDDIEVL